MHRSIITAVLLLISLPGHAGVIFTDLVGQLTTTNATRGLSIALINDADGLAATGGFEVRADGPGDTIYPPDPIRWVSGVQPTPFRAAATFQFDDTGNYLGVEPTPFRVLSATTGMLYGTLSLDRVVDAQIGSLTNITGAVFTTSNGQTLSVDPFSITASVISVPEPALLSLLLLVLLVRRALNAGN